MESKDLMDPLERKSKVVYEFCSDFKFEFENGDTISINKTVLAFHSKFFTDVFFGPTPAAEFQVENFDSETFKTFLDCLFGLKEYSVLDSLLIYPIAHHYQVKESMEKCVAVLKPKVLDENVALTLNLALFYSDDELVKNVISFIKTKYGIVHFLDNAKYRDLLEPKSVCRLIDEINLDSFVWNIIYVWGERYLAKQCKPIDIRSLFIDIGIFSKLKLDHFESVQAIFEFNEISNMQLLDLNQILQYWKADMSLSPSPKLPDRSEWVQLKKKVLLLGTVSISETIKFCHPIGFSSEKLKAGKYFEISMNKIFFEKVRDKSDLVLDISATYSFRSISNSYKDNKSFRHESNCRYDYSGWNACICFFPLKSSELSSSAPAVITLNFFRGEKPSEPVFKVKIAELGNKHQEIESVEIEYTFRNVDKARILMTNLNGNFQKDDMLYFTKNVVVVDKLL